MAWTCLSTPASFLASPPMSQPQQQQHRPSILPGDHGQERDLLRQLASADNIDTAVVQVLQEETNAVRLLDRRLGAPAVAAKLEAHISHLTVSLHHSLMPDRRQQLAAVLADAAALAGWQAIDMGRMDAAWNHFETATAAAREAHDNCLLAFAAGEQAYVLLDLGQPGQALDKVRAVHDRDPCRHPASDARLAARCRRRDGRRQP